MHPARSCGLPRMARVAAGSHGDNNVTPSAPPLPPELRTSERVKYPTVYKGSDYATGATGLAEGQPPVEESTFAEDTVEAQEQGQGFTDYQGQALAHDSTPHNNVYQVRSCKLAQGYCQESQFLVDATVLLPQCSKQILVLVGLDVMLHIFHESPVFRLVCNCDQAVDASAPAQFLRQTRWARPVLGALGLFFAGTLLLSVVRVLRRYNSPRSKRTRTVNLNKASLRTSPSLRTPCGM